MQSLSHMPTLSKIAQNTPEKENPNAKEMFAYTR